MKKIILIFSIAMFAYSAVNAQGAVSSSTGTATSSVTTPAVKTNLSEITFKNLVHDFGTVEKDASGNCFFIFTNTGTEPLTISEVKPECGCTVPKWPKDPILQGKSDTIKVTYTKMNIPLAHTFEKKIAVHSSAKNGSVTLTVKGATVDNSTKTTPLPTK